MAKIISSKDIKPDNDIYGNKTYGLLFLQKNKFSVPKFYVIGYNTLQQVEKKEISFSTLVSEWLQLNSIPSESLWSIRSSTNHEDSKQHAFAGLFKTLTNVKPSNMEAALAEVLSSYHSVNFPIETNGKPGYGIIIQQMVSADYSGVLFSQDPLNSRDKRPIINLIPGLGEMLVNGELEGINIRWKNGKAIYDATSETYEGVVFDKAKTSIRKSGVEIEKETTKFIRELVRGIKKLVSLKKLPLDVEFCISGDTIQWLQMRPMTALSQPEEYIWDNANIGDNYPDLSLPLTISYVKYTYTRSYTSMVKFLGMSNSTIKNNKSLFENMIGGIYGALYYNVTSWQKLLYQLPFRNKTTHQITKLWDMEGAKFERPSSGPTIYSYVTLLLNIITSFVLFNRHKRKFESILNQTLANANIGSLKQKNHNELISEYKKLDIRLTANWVVPVLNGFYLMLLYSLLKHLVENSRVNKLYPGFINKVLGTQQDVISAVLISDFKKILHEIYENHELLTLFRTATPANIIDVIGQKYKNLHFLINSFTESYGERCDGGELKIETINYKENPIGFIELIQMNVTNKPSSKADEKNVFDYRKVLRETYRYRWLKRTILLWLLKKTTQFIKNRENYRFMRLQGFHIARMIFRAMGTDLLKNQYILSAGDSQFLELREILDPLKCKEYVSYISTRKADYSRFESIERANRYIERNKAFTPVNKPIDGIVKNTLQGIGCCAGLVSSQVVVLNNKSIDGLDLTNKIIVAKFLEPGLVGLFANAQGIISERGNLLSHTAILCRELGIPSIVGVKGLTATVKEGQLVSMNGATGEIKIIDEKNETDHV